jgi:hypothetical protein
MRAGTEACRLPSNFGPQLFTPNLDRFAPLLEGASLRTPILQQVRYLCVRYPGYCVPATQHALPIDSIRRTMLRCGGSSTMISRVLALLCAASL